MAHARRWAAGFVGQEDEFAASSALDVAAETLEQEIARYDPALLDFEVTAPSADKAKDLVVELVQRGIDKLLPEEIKRGIVAVESRPDFGPIFPFQIDGYIDVILAGPILLFKDLKSAKDSREPEGLNKAQLRFYSLPWHVAGQEVELQIDTLPKTGKTQVMHTAVEASGDGYNDVRNWVLHTAGLISDAMRSGDFPAHPGRFCDFGHAMAA